MVLVILCGIPCAGKSQLAITLARKLELAHGLRTIVVDPDRIREMIPALTARFDPEREPFVNSLALALIELSLGNHNIVISDDMNYYESARHRLVQIARKHRVRYIILYLMISVETALRRNALRGTVIPGQLIQEVAKKFDRPGAKYRWDTPTLILDSEKLTSDQMAEQALELILDKTREKPKKTTAERRKHPRAKQRGTQESIRKSLDESTRKILSGLFSSGELDPRMAKEASKMRRAFVDEASIRRINKSEAMGIFRRRVKEQFA